MEEEEGEEEVIVSGGGVPQREYLYPQVFKETFLLLCGKRGVTTRVTHKKNVKVKLSITGTTSGSIYY
jgi:hypothetical protein